MDRDLVLMRLERSGVADYLTDRAVEALTNGAPPPSRALGAVRDWLEDREASSALVLLGDIGVGKTVAGAWALSTLADGRYVKEHDLVLMCERDAAAFEVYTSAPLLVIDELGWITDEQAIIAAYRAVFAERHAPKRTIVLGGLDKEASITRLFAALGLTDDGGPAMVRTVRGESLR